MPWSMAEHRALRKLGKKLIRFRGTYEKRAFCTAGEYDAILENPNVQNMPLFPKEGSISQVDDIIVVKISE